MTPNQLNKSPPYPIQKKMKNQKKKKKKHTQKNQK